jgi:hypothetical protein
VRYAATVKQLIDGRFLARALATDVGVCEATADSRDAALEQLRKEIRYRLEWCPCSGVADDYVELWVSDSAPASARDPSRT